MKQFTESQIDDLIKLRYGKLTSADHVAYVSNATLGKIFGISGSQARRLYMARFQSIADQQLPFLLQFTKQMEKQRRRRWGLRFLRQHEINWLVEAKTLRQQTGMSLYDRTQQFLKEFPSAHMNPTLLS